jgi:hypothetical protein
MAGGSGLGYRPVLSKAFLGHCLVGRPGNSPVVQYSNLAQTCKFKHTVFPRSKIIQTLHDVFFEHDEQLYELVQLQIPSIIHVINFGTNYNLNFPQILKGFKPCWKNLVNSLKFYLYVIFINLNLVGYTCMQDIGVPIQESIWLDLKI